MDEKVNDGNSSAEIIKFDNKSYSLEDFKSLYYLLNAKPDTDIKIFTERKKIRFEDIVELNAFVQEKIENHNMVTNMTKVTVVLANNRVQDFGTWKEFTKTNWSISAHTQSLILRWEMNFNLPTHKLPQPHTMTLKLGAGLNASELFHLIVSKEMHEITSEFSDFVCKIDFINPVICNELFGIVSEWHAALPKLDPERNVVRLLLKHPWRMKELIKAIFIFAGIGALVSVTHMILSNIEFNSGTKLFLEFNYIWISVAFIITYLMSVFGKGFANLVDRNIRKLSEQPIFEITKGDKNRIDEIRKGNDKILKQIGIQMIISVAVFIFSMLLRFVKSDIGDKNKRKIKKPA